MDRAPRGTTPRAAAAAGCVAVSAATWLAVWLHQYRSHGRTSVNEMRLVLGLTWMDAAKVLPFAVLLLLPGLEVVVRRARAGGGSSRPVWLGRTVQGCLVVAAVSGAADFWPFPLGSYAVTFEDRGSGVPWQFLATLLAAVVLVALAVVRRRAPDGEWVALGILASGVLVSALWTPVWLWPALAWAAFAGWLWWSGARRPLSSPAQPGPGGGTSRVGDPAP